MLTACGDKQSEQGQAQDGGFGQSGVAQAAFAGPNGAQPAGQGGMYTVVDTAGGANMPALQVSMPPGWRGESMVRWDNDQGHCTYDIASPMFRLTSPDGKQSIEALPGFLVTTNEQNIRYRGSQPGDFCIIAEADSGEALAQRVAIPFLRPQSRIQSMRQVQIDPKVAASAQRIQAQAAMIGGTRVIPYAVETTLGAPDGTIEKITLHGIVTASDSVGPGFPRLVLNQNMVAYAVRAPAERMAETEAMAAQVRQSVRFNPQWKTAVEQFQQKATKPVFASSSGAGGGGAGGARTGGGDWMDASKRSWDANQASSDDAQRRRIESIREEQRCPQGDGTVVVTTIHANC